MPENRSRLVTLTQQALALGAVVAVAAPATGVMSLDIVAPTPRPTVTAAAGDHVRGSLVASQPVVPKVKEVRIGGVDPRGLQALTGPARARQVAQDDLAALTPPEPVSGYATVGVTWRRGAVRGARITLAVRTRTDGVWSGWQQLPYDPEEGPDPDSPEGRAARPGTDPVVVGSVDDVQVKAVTPSGKSPAGLQLALVDPGQTVAPKVEQPAIDTAKLASAEAATDPATDPTATPTDPTTTDPTATPTTDPTTDPTAAPTDPAADPSVDTAALTGAADVTPKPKIFSRAQWGADESMRDKSSLRYYEVHAGFVHHTVNANGYTRAQVPAIIRGIYAYHTQSKGWSDIGYNFLVDRFGRIWEGRYGGVDRPVVGAHTLGYNDYAFAMSAIGNYDVGRPSSAMLAAYGRLFAWKLSLHGVSAGSMRQWVGKRYLPAINGHRDVGQTACPGRYLYAKIPTIRTLAAQDQHPFRARQRNTDLTGASWPDLVVRDQTTKEVYVVQTGGQSGFARGRVAARGFGGKDLLTFPGDLTGDGVADVLARDARTKVASVFPGTSTGHFATAVNTSKRFATRDQVTGVGDLNGDGRNDVVVRNAGNKRLLFFPGNGHGAFGRQRVLSRDWSAYDLTAGVGDLNGDGRTDLVARDGAGVLWLFPGTGRPRLGAPVALPGRWGGFDVIAGRGDVTNDGKPDLVARVRKTKQTFVYPGDGQGGLTARYGPFSGYKGLNVMATGGQLKGSGSPDLVGRDGAGRLVVYPNTDRRNVSGMVDTGQRFANANLVLAVGDWNGDGHGDVITRTGAGVLYLHAGDGTGHFAAPVLVASGFGSVNLLSAVGDITGDGFPDLMGQPSGGAMRIYPGNGTTGLRPSYVAHAAVAGNDQLGVGLWNADGSPDTVVRRTDGTLALYPGNGPGGLVGGGTKVGGAAARYSWLQGVGDADGDGRADIVARDGLGRLWLLPGTASGSIGPRRFIADGFGGYDLGS